MAKRKRRKQLTPVDALFTPVKEGEKRCPHCLVPQPITNFRLRHKNTENRHNDCNKCHWSARARIMKEREIARRTNELLAFASRSNQCHWKAPAIERLAVSVLDRFGGHENFILAVGACFERSLAAKEVYAQTRLVLFCAELITAGERSARARSAIIEVDRMENAELQDEIDAEFDYAVDMEIERRIAAGELVRVNRTALE